jgi:hypothetical protein
MRWSEVVELTTEDKEFLLNKVEGVKAQMRAQQFAGAPQV